MDDLAELLEQSAVAARLASVLLRPGPQRAWLKGKSGTGKSTVLALTAKRLGETGAVVTIIGNLGWRETKFLALQRALKGKAPSKAQRDAQRTAPSSSLKMIPVIGTAAADLAQVILSARRTEEADFLSSDEQEILQLLQSAAQPMRLFIIVDDVGWIDADTARLLLSFSLPEVQKAYPFCRDVSILFAENVDAEAVLDSNLLDRLRPDEAITLQRVSRAAFPEVLRLFGFTRSLDTALVDQLYAVSQGHLEIMRQIAKIDRGEDIHSLVAELDSGEFTRQLLAVRLRAVSNGGTSRLLAIAACAGSSVSKQELACAFDDAAKFPSVLETALRENLLIPEGETVRFVHEAIRRASEGLEAAEIADYHARLAKCLKLLRPGDYAARLRHLRRSGATEAARELQFVLALQAARGETAISVQRPEGRLAQVLADAGAAYALMDRGEHDRAAELMTEHYDGTHGLVQGEIVALIALNHIKRRTLAGYRSAASLLAPWRHWEEEPELHERLMSILVAALSMSGDWSGASALYGQLVGELLRRSDVERWARSRAEALSRKADMFLSTELALKQIERAARWFGPSEATDLPRNAFEYTACLINISGARYTMGRFDGAAETARTAIECMGAVRPRGLRTAEPYKALNNYVIAAFRAGIETAEQGFAALDSVAGAEPEPWLRDRCLFAINRGVLAMLAGRAEIAAAILQGVWDHVIEEELDGYYQLYAASNLAAVRALTGDRAEALRLLAAAGSVLHYVPHWLEPFHRRRHQLVLAAVERGGIAATDEWDRYPSSVRAPAGTQDFWWSIGHGFLMSDIQVWSEG